MSQNIENLRDNIYDYYEEGVFVSTITDKGGHLIPNYNYVCKACKARNKKTKEGETVTINALQHVNSNLTRHLGTIGHDKEIKEYREANKTKQHKRERSASPARNLPGSPASIFRNIHPQSPLTIDGKIQPTINSTLHGKVYTKEKFTLNSLQ
jgi:hypothetical protein